jgi:hypothetical protein
MIGSNDSGQEEYEECKIWQKQAVLEVHAVSEVRLEIAC